MKIRMIAALSGLRDGVAWPAPGGEIVVPDAEGAELCANGYAEPIAQAARVETRPAAVEPETAEAPKAATRPGRRSVKSDG